VDLSRAEVWQDLHALVGPARERFPLARSALGDGWTVLRYADVESVLRDPRFDSVGTEMIESQGIVDGPLHRWWQRILFGTNPPTHTRLRALLARAFTPRSVDDFRPRVREIAHELIDKVEDAGRMDVVEDFAHHLPVRVISEMFAVPTRDYEQFARWTSDLGLAFSAYITPEVREITEAAVRNLYDYVAGLIDERRAHPGDDLVSALIVAEEEGDRLSHEELLAMVVNLLFAGHDTTKSLLSIAVKTLLEHPAELKRLRANPRLGASAVDEVLRYESPVLGLLRVAREPAQVAGVEIEPGTQIFISLLAANRDPRQFAEPDRFDIQRSENRHFAFGFGLHYCIGAPLARAEAEEALPVLFSRCPKLALSGDAPRWVPYAAIRRLETLTVTY
jgi:cytochrome P450